MSIVIKDSRTILGNRICCVFGTWQLLSLVASLRHSADDAAATGYDDYLVLYETAGVSDEFKAALAELASRVWRWKRIVWAYDLLTSERRYGDLQIRKVHRQVRSTIGLEKGTVDQIWACFINRPSEKLVLDAYPEAKVLLYEDGLISYLPVAGEPKASERTGLRARVGDVVKSGLMRISPAFRLRKLAHSIERRHLVRVQCFYSLLSDLSTPAGLSCVPRRQVPSLLMLEVIRLAGQGSFGNNAGATGSARPRVLMLGQALSRNGIMTYEQEAAIYRNVAGQLIRSGYDVVWKEHPRIRRPFLAELQEVAATHDASEAVTEADLPHALPIELLAPHLGVAGCVAGTSAALLYLNWLYGMAVYTFSEALVPLMRGADLLMSDMVRSHAKPMSELPPSNDRHFIDQV